MARSSPPGRTDAVVDQGCCGSCAGTLRRATGTPMERSPRTRSGADLPAHPAVRNGSARVGTQPDDHLAGVAAAQEVEERRHRLLQTLPDGLADDEVARAHPA